MKAFGDEQQNSDE